MKIKFQVRLNQMIILKRASDVLYKKNFTAFNLYFMCDIKSNMNFASFFRLVKFAVRLNKIKTVKRCSDVL